MASPKEIRTQIKSIRSTQKITKAMEMVAASKMRKVQARMSASRPYAQRMRQVDRVLHDVNFVFEIGRNVDRRIGDKQRARVSRRIHNEHMRNSSRRAQACVALHHRLQQLVSVQTAFHQRQCIA